MVYVLDRYATLATPFQTLLAEEDVQNWQSTFVVLEGELSSWLRDLPA